VCMLVVNVVCALCVCVSVCVSVCVNCWVPVTSLVYSCPGGVEVGVKASKVLRFGP
jgi:hypothetical protein